VSRLQAGELVVLDPLDNTTTLPTADGIEAVSRFGLPNYRSFGTTLEQLSNVVITTPQPSFFLVYDGTNYVNRDPDQVVTALELQPGGDNDIWVNQSGDTMSGNLVMEAASVLFEESGGSNTVGFQPPTSIPTSVTWTLPATDSTGVQALVSDGNGNLSFSDLPEQDLYETVAGDTGSTAPSSPTDTLTLAGGVGIATVATPDTVTIDLSANLDDLNDVTVTTPSVGETLVYTGVGWENQPGPFGDFATVQVRRSTSFNLPLAFQAISFNVTDVETDSTVVEHDNTNTERILIKQTGLYNIGYSASVDADAGEEQMSFRVVVGTNTTAIPGSQRVISEDDEINDVSNVFSVVLTAGQYITFQCFASGTGNVLVTDSTFWIQRAGGVKGEQGNTGTVGDLAAVQARRTTTLANIPTTWTDVNLNATDFENDPSLVEHDNTNTDRIQIKAAGVYEVWYTVSALEEIQSRVRVNDSTVIPGSTQQAGRQGGFDITNDIYSISNKTIRQFAAGEYVTLQIQSAVGDDTLQANAVLSVTKLEGAPGQDGAPGSGVAIIIEDEGSVVAGGPHERLNFVGDGVNVSNAGGAEATINIPGFEGKRHFCHHNGNTTQALSGSFVTALFNTDVRTDSIYSYTSGEVTVDDAGWYEVTYDIGAESTNGDRSTMECVLQVNSINVPGTFAYGYHRTTGEGDDTASMSTLVELNTNDIIRVRIRIEDGTGIITKSNACRLLIKEVDDPS
jgi:hypothetical protein